jgi:hypothetical protein
MSREARDAAKRAYDEAVEQASKVWAAAMSQAMDKGRQAALKAYDEAIAQGLDEAKALEKSIVVAVKTHQEAVAPAQKAYDEACEQALAAFMRFNLMSRQARDAAKKPTMRLWSKPPKFGLGPCPKP